MTHGDKAKAKIGKSSQASENDKAVKAAAGRKGGGTESGQGGKAGSGGGKVADKIALKKQSGPDEGSASSKKAAAPAAKESGAKGRPAAGSDSGGFSNPAIANAFRRAIQKYPNAFRKLTD